MSGINALEKAEVNFIIMAANSPHAVYKELKKLTSVKILSIVSATVKQAKKEGLKNLLLLGINFTMQSTFYQEYSKKLGIDIITHSEDEQDEIDKIIFDDFTIDCVLKFNK